MPRFSVAFGRRRSTVNSEEFLQNGPVTTGDQQQQQSSFRVLERTEVGGNKSFDGGHRLLKAATTAIPPKHYNDLSLEDNMFADVKNNRYVHPPRLLAPFHFQTHILGPGKKQQGVGDRESEETKESERRKGKRERKEKGTGKKK